MSRLFMFLSLISLSFNLSAHSFLEGNGPKLPIGVESNVSKNDFNLLLDNLEKLYKKEARKMGKRLSISGKYNSNIVNAYALQVYPGTMTVRVLGGIVRHPLMTYDGLALVVCHEIGHHMGGAPRKWERMNKWASDEGQSDYFAPLQCLRRLWKNDNNEAIINQRKEKISETHSKCIQSYSDAKEIALCERTLYAALDVTKLVAAARHEDESPNLGTFDPKVVEKTNQEHPASQCRLDTMLAGTLCTKSPEVFDGVNAENGVCSELSGDIIGTRPHCWYAPIKE